ncbi:hypothetical protein [Maribacter hydrothermalis]|uniref:DoxX family protein n=1 Tax=Maribacter hydrothermalis TaxID=1836467 RepID=A0A1B7ZC08_9FLAO|nr:hypothetical protein [Maribacter hydrothermalis]APQ16033.1 hypothetical protein BTR34_01165 [Maribacter hydrothermalis]OBR40450.1 hypothetical protein A9200_16370 [Maribacter hydrothermalis]
MLLIFPFPLDVFPKFDFFEKLVPNIYQYIVPWIGEHILKLEEPITVFENGSGDKTYDYVLLLFILSIALLGAILWSFLLKNANGYAKLNYWFLVLVRYSLGSTMIYYGLFKIMPLQFGEIAFWRMLQPYGDSSPMGLAWTFLGYSKGYNLFMGLAEFIGGILLFHRRTTLLGSLILLPVTANIVAINFFYDVPVKLFSSQLLLMAIIIIVPDIKRLWNVIVFNKATKKIEFENYFKSRKWAIRATILKWAIVILILFNSISYTTGIYSKNIDKPELYGLYEVNLFKRNRDTVPPILNNEKRWRHVFFEYPNTTQFSTMAKGRYGLRTEVDTLKKQIKLTEYNDTTAVYILKYKRTDSTLNLSGVFRKDTIFCETKRLDKKDFRLTSRGFNWVNEYPYNR